MIDTGLNDQAKKKIFQDLSRMGRYQAAVHAGLDKKVKRGDKRTLERIISKVVAEVRADPKRFEIGNDMLEIVDRAMEERRVGGPGPMRDPRKFLPATPEEDMSLEEMPVKMLVTRANRGAWFLVNKKLEKLVKTPSLLSKVSLDTLVRTAGISFDKSQIVKGEATQHIALKAKVDVNVSPEEKLQMILQIREKITTPFDE